MDWRRSKEENKVKMEFIDQSNEITNDISEWSRYN